MPFTSNAHRMYRSSAPWVKTIMKNWILSTHDTSLNHGTIGYHSQSYLCPVPCIRHPASPSFATSSNASGYNINYITLPSVGPSEHLSDFRPYVEKILTAILKAADTIRKVVLVVHSYGSLPANESNSRS